MAPTPPLKPVICDEGDPCRCPHMNLFVSDPRMVRCSFHSTPTPEGSTAEPAVGGAIAMSRDDMCIIIMSRDDMCINADSSWHRLKTRCSIL
jgi:hypothetical protein